MSCFSPQATGLITLSNFICHALGVHLSACLNISFNEGVTASQGYTPHCCFWQATGLVTTLLPGVHLLVVYLSMLGGDNNTHNHGANGFVLESI